MYRPQEVRDEEKNAGCRDCRRRNRTLSSTTVERLILIRDTLQQRASDNGNKISRRSPPAGDICVRLAQAFSTLVTSPPACDNRTADPPVPLALTHPIPCSHIYTYLSKFIHNESSSGNQSILPMHKLQSTWHFGFTMIMTYKVT